MSITKSTIKSNGNGTFLCNAKYMIKSCQIYHEKRKDSGFKYFCSRKMRLPDSWVNLFWLRNHSCWSQQSVQYHQDGNPPNIHPWVKVRAILFNQLWQNNCMCLQQTITIAAIEWTNTINHRTSIATRLNNEIFDIDLALLLNF